LPSWVVPLRATGTRPPLFCACAGGGDVMEYRDLAQALPADQPVYVFGLPPQLAGAAFPRVEQLAAIYVGTVRSVQADGPYYLCGHSFGGLVAYEMAASLADAGSQVRLVALLDTLHPAYKRKMSRRDRIRFKITYLVDRLTKYARNLRRGRPDRVLRDAIVAACGRIKHLYWRVVRNVFGQLGRAPPALISSKALILAAAWHGYQAKDHDLPLVLFNARDRATEFHGDRTLGWQSCVSRPLTLHLVSGDHYSMLHPPHVQVLAASLAPFLGPCTETARAAESAGM
jgi:thioesterase domain-containing protein